MERIGLVNTYHCTHCDNAYFVMLLNTGVTPFSRTCDKCGELKRSRSRHAGGIPSGGYMASEMYTIPPGQRRVRVTHVAYRPAEVEEIVDINVITHLANGGLLFAELGEPIKPAWPDCGRMATFREWAEYALKLWAWHPPMVRAIQQLERGTGC